MKEIIIDFIGSKWFVYTMWIYLYALIVYIIYSALNYFKYYSRMQKTIQSLYVQMSDQERARAEAERQERDIHGEGIKIDWLGKLDEELAYSGIKSKIKWMTTELYIVIVTVTATLVTIGVTMSYGFVKGIASFIVTLLAFKVMITLLSNARERQTDSQLLQFMNIIDNFSRTSDDLIDILEKTSRYVDDPLGTQVYEAVQSARNTGDSVTALQELQDNIKNKHFKILMRNLQTSSRFENNYSDIIEDCRAMFHDYIKARKEKRSLRINGMAEIFIMIIVGIICISMMGDFTEQGNIIEFLLDSGTPGIALFFVMIVAILLSLYIAIFKVLREQ